MATVRLSWSDPNSGPTQETEIRVYRSEATFTIASLPPVLATLLADVVTYDDTTAVGGVTYFYAVAAVKGSVVALSDVVSIGVGAAVDLSTVLSTQWRLVFEESLSANIWVGQVEMRETIGGPNVAIHGTTGAASSPSPVNTGFEPDKAFNGGATGDGWFTSISSVGGGILDFTFDVARNIKQVAIKSPSASTPSDMKRMIVQCKVGADWVNMALHTNATQFATSETRLYSAFAQGVFDIFMGDVDG